MTENSDLSKKLMQRNAELAVINSVQQGIVAKIDMQVIYDLVGTKIRDLFDSQVTVIATFNNETKTENFQYVFESGKLVNLKPRPYDKIRERLINTQKLINIEENAKKAYTTITGEAPVAAPGTVFPKSMVFVPLMVEDSVQGYVSLQNLDKEHAFSSSDVQLLSTLANSVSMALENARLFKKTEQRNAELAVINSVQDGLVREMDLQSIYDLVGERIRHLFDAQVVIIANFDYENSTEEFHYIFEDGKRFYTKPRPYDKVRERLIETKELIWINENTTEVLLNISGESPTSIPGTDFPKSVVFVPLIIGNTVRGYVSLQNLDREHAFSKSKVRLLSTLANSMSVALENARLFNETEQRATELQTVNRISHALVSQLDFDALINLIGELMKETFKADIVYVAQYNRDTDMIHFPYEYGDINKPRKFGDGFTEQIIKTNKALLINKDLVEKRAQLQASQIGKITSSFLGVPIQIGGKPSGVISIQSTEEENRFDENDQRLLTTIAANVGVAIQNAESYKKLGSALSNLKAAQTQLVQQEKLASLGQLTAGIAHEIKNPLNFVNNFSELSVELVEEAREEVKEINSKFKIKNLELIPILDDIEANLRKIHEHGSRADRIVKSMLQHSRGGSGKMEPTDLNALVKEYVNLSFHGMRAGKNPINVDIQFELGEGVGEVPLIAEDFSRVIVNLCNNAFDAMKEKQNSESRILNSEEYTPKLTIATKNEFNKIIIEVEDNGPGIPEEMKDKIMQPFFTTKKGTDGTGLGLSITNDIVKAHGGSMNIESEKGFFTRFKILIDI